MSNQKELIKVEGELGLFRDSASGGIVADDSAYQRYKKEKEKRLRETIQEARINRLEEEVHSLREGVAEILSILKGAK